MTALVPAVGGAMVVAGLIGVLMGLMPHPVRTAAPGLVGFQRTATFA